MEAAAVPHEVVDVAELTKFMNEELDALRLRRRSGQRPTIHRVLSTVRKTDSSAYEPRIISIGPFHRDKPELRPMEKLKWQYLQDLLARNSEVRLQDAITRVGKKLKNIRQEYSEVFANINDHEFLKMMVLDGCFILEYMWKVEALPADGGGSWVWPWLRHDLLLLENQIPFHVLGTLFETMGPFQSSSTLLQIAYKAFVARNHTHFPEPDIEIRHLLHLDQYYLVSHYKMEQQSSLSQWQMACRLLPLIPGMAFRSIFQFCFWLLYLLFSCMLCSPPQQCRTLCTRSTMPGIIPSLTKLKQAGVRFRKKKSSSTLNITFSYQEGVFEFPGMMLHTGSKSRFRNLIAFEQGCWEENIEQHVTSFCFVMSSLIDTESDVDVLEEKGILLNYMRNSSELAKLFDGVCTGATLPFKDHPYSQLLKDVNRYCESEFHRWWARLMRDYFGSPWAFLSVMAATLLLGLTAAQSFYTIYAYYKPRGHD